MADRPDLTIVIETTTADITGTCDARQNLLAWASQAQAAGCNVELLVVGPRVVRGLAELDAGVPTRFLEVPGAGYYGLKNAGANAATGALILFTDADCRPSPGYVDALLRAFQDPGVAGVASRSVYEGTSFLTRLNSVHSFGDLHCGQKAFDRGGMVLTHGVALRRESCERDPFGPFGSRVGGDRFVTDLVRRRGGRIRLVDELVIHHEDISYSLRGTIERHLRETIVPLGYGTPRQRVSSAYALLCALLLRPAVRLRRVLRAGPRLEISALHLPLVAVVQVGYWAFDVLCVTGVLLMPPLRRRWLRFQFGSE